MQRYSHSLRQCHSMLWRRAGRALQSPLAPPPAHTGAQPHSKACPAAPSTSPDDAISADRLSHIGCRAQLPPPAAPPPRWHAPTQSLKAHCRFPLLPPAPRAAAASAPNSAADTHTRRARPPRGAPRRRAAIAARPRGSAAPPATPEAPGEAPPPPLPAPEATEQEGGKGGQRPGAPPPPPPVEWRTWGTRGFRSGGRCWGTARRTSGRSGRGAPGRSGDACARVSLTSSGGWSGLWSQAGAP